MKKQDIVDIESFIRKEINHYDLKYDYYIEEETLCATFKGHFTSQKEIDLTFRCVSGDVEVYSLCESYIHCGTREFWIELMGRLIA